MHKCSTEGAQSISLLVEVFSNRTLAKGQGTAINYLALLMLNKKTAMQIEETVLRRREGKVDQSSRILSGVVLFNVVSMHRDGSS